VGVIPMQITHSNQVADLNALNATMAVISGRRCAALLDLEKEHHSTYTIDGKSC